jgi:hypothetical protein
MTNGNENIVGPDDDDGDEQESRAYRNPVYPKITRAQWVWLVAQTDQNCTDALDAVVFYKSLSKEARDFLRAADKTEIELIQSNLTFYSNSKIIWKFLWVGGGMLFAGLMGVLGFMKLFGEYISVKIK